MKRKIVILIGLKSILRYLTFQKWAKKSTIGKKHGENWILKTLDFYKQGNKSKSTIKLVASLVKKVITM